MRNEITTKEKNGRRIIQMRGGRDTQIIDKTRYTRKRKYRKDLTITVS